MGGGISSAGFFEDGQGVTIGPEGDGIAFAEVKKGAQAVFNGGKQPTFQALNQMLRHQGTVSKSFCHP